MAEKTYEFSVARLKACRLRPYLSTALASLVYVESPAGPMGVGTMAVDKWWRCYVDPAIYDKWTVDQQAGVLIHEVSHLLREHHRRFEKHEYPLLANIAEDMEINDDLAAEHVVLPGDVVLPSRFNLPDGEIAEWYYRELLKNAKPMGGGDGKAKPGGGRCGSAATGKPEPWEQAGPSESQPGVSEARSEVIRRKTAQDIREASKAAGNVPYSWKTWADEYLEPQIDWRKELPAMVRGAIAETMGMMDYSYRKLARRDSDPFVFPSLRAPIPRCAIIVDTSGSMSGTENEVVAEIGGVLKAACHLDGVPVICCDAAVSTVRTIFSRSRVELTGGGGTDLRPAIEAAAKLRPRPNVLIIISDCEMYDGWGEAPAGMKSIVARIGTGQPPAWAKTIDIQQAA